MGAGEAGAATVNAMADAGLSIAALFVALVAVLVLGAAVFALWKIGPLLVAAFNNLAAALNAVQATLNDNTKRTTDRLAEQTTALNLLRVEQQGSFAALGGAVQRAEVSAKAAPEETTKALQAELVKSEERLLSGLGGKLDEHALKLNADLRAILDKYDKGISDLVALRAPLVDFLGRAVSAPASQQPSPLGADVPTA